MVSFRVVSDSTADFPQEYNVPLAPIHVYVGATDFRDKIDFTKERYLDAEKKGVPLRTAAPSPKDWLSAYESAGKDAPIIAFTITSRLSSSAKTAEIAARIARKRGFDVRVFDTWSGGIGMGLLIREALHMAEANVPAGKALEKLYDLRKRLKLYVALADPRAVARSGRMPALVANLGFAFGIRPVVTVIDGAFHAFKISRQSKVLDLFAELVKDRDDVWFSDVSGGDFAERAWEIVRSQVKNALRIPVGPGLSVHFGRGSFGVGFFE